jgi:CRISPR-associated protein Cas2
MKAVVTYDVSSDPRRKKIADLLANVLTRVQLSVFEGELPAEVLKRWVGKASALLDPETDSLRVYQLCGVCAMKVEVYGRTRPLEEGDVRIL